MTVSLHVNSSCQVVENFFQTMIETTSRFNRNVTKFLKPPRYIHPQTEANRLFCWLGTPRAKDLFLSLVTQEALTSRYEFIISQDIQLACFDDQHESNSSVSEQLFSSKGYQDSNIIIAASRYYENNRCNRRNASKPISSDHKGLANLINKSLANGKKVVAFSNIPEFLGRNLLDEFVSKVTIKEKSTVSQAANPLEALEAEN